MNVMPARNLDNARPGRQALLNDPKLLGRRPPPSPLRTGPDRTVTVVTFAHLFANQ
jgi:hypothetical protein